MNGADDETQSGRGGRGLGDSAQRATLPPRDRGKVLVEQLRRRWKMLGTILATAVTTYALYNVDETLTLDVWAFGGLTVVLFVYTVVTVRSDMKIE